jgi:rRNA-processing protein FCF1
VAREPGERWCPTRQALREVRRRLLAGISHQVVVDEIEEVKREARQQASGVARAAVQARRQARATAAEAASLAEAAEEVGDVFGGMHRRDGG